MTRKVHKTDHYLIAGHSFAAYTVTLCGSFGWLTSMRWKKVTCKKCLNLRKKREFNKQK